MAGVDFNRPRMVKDALGNWSSSGQPLGGLGANSSPLTQTNYLGQKTQFNQFSQSFVPVPQQPAAPASSGGSGGGSGSGGGGGSYVPPPLPPVGPVPVNNGNLPSVGAGTETGSMMPPSAPGVGWQSVSGGGGLNDRLGNRLQRQSMNQLSAGIY